MDAEERFKRYSCALEASKERISNLRAEIHRIKFTRDNQAVKPSGKLRFMSAYRFFRREMVPVVKAERPELEGKQRHQLIRAQWQQLSDDRKFNYVMMSRADRDKALYINKLVQLKETLPLDIPASIAKHFGVSREDQKVFTYEAPIVRRSGEEPVILEDVDGETSCDEAVERRPFGGEGAKRDQEGPKADKRFTQLSIVQFFK